MSNDDDEALMSLERARADIEIIQSCYPDEITASSSYEDTFPFSFTLQLSPGSGLTFKLEEGYPAISGVQISDYRTDSFKQKARLEAVVRAVRKASKECLEDDMEGSMTCCATALEIWQNYGVDPHADEYEDEDGGCCCSPPPPKPPLKHYEWLSGEPLMDRKSSFQAHLCEVHTEQEAREALQQLLTSTSKIQRASHNMSAWRIAERQDDKVIIKHDNDDDGEDAAGNKLAFLLDMRKDENVLVVVSRWYGGIHLGPKRFAHIVNVARELLVEHTEDKGEKAK